MTKPTVSITISPVGVKVQYGEEKASALTKPITLDVAVPEVIAETAKVLYEPVETYDGATTVTPTKAVQTLATSGKKLESDVTVEAISDDWYDMSGPESFLGLEAEAIGVTYSETFTLADTNYPTWTPTTTATTIRATKTATTFVADMEDYEYLIRWRTRVDYAYLEGHPGTLEPTRYGGVIWQVVHRRPNNLARLVANQWVYNYAIALFTSSIFTGYKNASGTETFTTTNYGVYSSSTVPTFSSTTSNTPTVTVRCPAITARCYSTVFPVATAPYVDPDNTTIKIVADVFRVKIRSNLGRRSFEEAADIFNNGL